MSDIIEIPFSKQKILLLLIGAVGFVTLGILFIIYSETLETRLLSSDLIRVAGIAAIVFFGVCFVFIAMKLLDQKTGLTIDENGITDHSNATSVGLIEWKDITRIETIKVESTSILILQTNQPEKYISRARNWLSKRAMKANYKMYGSPISIISGSLKIKFNDLERLISEEFERRKQ